MRKLTIKIIAVTLVLSVLGLLASCQKVEADYVLVFENSNTSYYYAISNDELKELTAHQYGSVVSENSEFDPCAQEMGALTITAEGDDPSAWEYIDDISAPLDPEQEQFWADMMTAIDAPYRGTLHVLFYEFDDYMVVHVMKNGLETEQTVAVLHGDKFIGTIDENALLSKVYKH